MLPFLVNIWPQFFDVCNDSHKKYSLKFFTDPVVQHLWGRFKIHKTSIIAEYIQLAGKSVLEHTLGIDNNILNLVSPQNESHTLTQHACKDSFHKAEDNITVKNGIPQSHSAENSNTMFFTFDDLFDQEVVTTKKSSDSEEQHIQHDLDFLNSDQQNEIEESCAHAENKDEEEEKDESVSEPLDLSDNTFLDHVALVTGCQFRRQEKHNNRIILRNVS